MDLFLFFIFGIFSVSLVAGSRERRYGVLYGESADNPSRSGQYCATFDPDFREVPHRRQDAVKLPLADAMAHQWCAEPVPPTPPIDGAAAAVARGNCTFAEKARLVQEHGGEMALIVSADGLPIPTGNANGSDYHDINITVAVMEERPFRELKALGGRVTVQLYSPPDPRADYNLLLIWAMAVGSVLLGAWWSGHVRHSIRQSQRRKSRDAAAQKREAEDAMFDVKPITVLVFVALMSTILILLYFFYNYLVYLIIGLFTLASCMALYACLKPLLLRVPCIPNTRVPCYVRQCGQPEIRRIVLALLCIGVSVWWAIERNEPYAWILQDVLGVAFCINMMKTIRLPSLKACTLLLSLLFIYDVFFVFVTPYFTKSGDSVMVEVATGGAGGEATEQLPMVLKVPRFSSSVLTLCSVPYSLLGFGDILVPGLLISYCHGFDLKVQSGRLYYVATVIAYAVGLVLTFVALALMRAGQPALLYLVPCTLLTVLLLAWRRGDLGAMWAGDKKERAQPRRDPSTDAADGAPPADPQDGVVADATSEKGGCGGEAGAPAGSPGSPRPGGGSGGLVSNGSLDAGPGAVSEPDVPSISGNEQQMLINKG